MVVSVGEGVAVGDGFPPGGVEGGSVGGEVGGGLAVGGGLVGGLVGGGLAGGGLVGGGLAGGGLTAALAMGRRTTTLGAAHAAMPRPRIIVRREIREESPTPSLPLLIGYHSPQSHRSLV